MAYQIKRPQKKKQKAINIHVHSTPIDYDLLSRKLLSHKDSILNNTNKEKFGCFYDREKKQYGYKSKYWDLRGDPPRVVHKRPLLPLRRNKAGLVPFLRRCLHLLRHLMQGESLRE